MIGGTRARQSVKREHQPALPGAACCRPEDSCCGSQSAAILSDMTSESHAFRRKILRSLSRDALAEVTEHFGVSVTDGRQIDAHVKALAKAPLTPVLVSVDPACDRDPSLIFSGACPSRIRSS